MILTLEQFHVVRDEIYKRLGLYFEDAKLLFIQKRVERRIKTLNLERFEDYSFLLRYCDADGKEMQALANLVTTNETYMFREFEQLQAFADFCLPEVLNAKDKRGDRTLRIWSAGCSSGEEPYTLAIILREVMHDFPAWDVSILATDIDEERLTMARVAEYEARSVKEVPEEYLARHFRKTDQGRYRVRPETAACVDVRHLNLHDRAAMRAVRRMDFIFCRNVLIYFDDASRKAVVDHFYTALNRNGFLYLGHSESVGRISTAYELRRLGPHLVYCKK